MAKLKNDVKETSIGYISGENTATFYSADMFWIQKMRKWVKKYPNDVKLVAVNKDKSMLINVPISWLSVDPNNHMIEVNVE